MYIYKINRKHRFINDLISYYICIKKEGDCLMKKKKPSINLVYLGVSLCVILLLIASGCGTKTESPTAAQPTATSQPAATAQTPQHGGTLIISLPNDTNIIGDPAVTQKYGKVMQKPAVEALARFNEKGDIVPWLAEGWETDPVAKTLTVTIKKGIKFHDGTNFDAAAVKWNWEHQINMKKQEMQSVGSIDVIDDYTVRANLKQWDSSIVYDCCWFAGGMASPTAWETHDQGWFEKNPVGTGPFKFVSWQHDVSVIFEKFDGYWQEGKPYLDGIKFIFIPDAAVRQADFEAGETNLIFQVPPDMANTLKMTGKYIETTLKNGNGTTQWMLAPDSGHPDSIFYDAKIRQALEYAIDKDTIANSLFYGYYVVSNQWGPPENSAYSPNYKGRPYNPAKAKELLAEAGYPDGFNTYILGKPSDKPMLLALQSNLAEAGINLELNILEVGALISGPVMQGWDDGLLLMAVQPNGDVLSRLGWVQTGAPLMPCILYTDETDQMIKEAKAAPDAATKQALTWKVQERVFGEQAVIIPLWLIDDIAFRHQNVHNDGLAVIEGGQWTPEDAWMEP
jgi:peptide/nickel transport system substrate-binding protein